MYEMIFMKKTELILTPLKDGERFKVLEDWITEIDNEFYVIVKKDFVTDFASIPKILNSVIGDSIGLYTEAAIIHDYIYQNRIMYLKYDDTEIHLSRKECDKIFYRKMLSSGVGKFKAKTMWLAVRAFGWKFYKK